MLFARLSTQWRVAMGGATGLDYTALYPLLDREAQTREEWNAMFDDVREMEAAALAAMNESRE